MLERLQIALNVLSVCYELKERLIYLDCVVIHTELVFLSFKLVLLLS